MTAFLHFPQNEVSPVPQDRLSTRGSGVASPERRFNRNLGLLFFSIYLLLYLTFVFANAFNPSLMETIVLAGLNLAIVYGFGLILAALLMALLYGSLCRNETQDHNETLRQIETQGQNETQGHSKVAVTDVSASDAGNGGQDV